MATTAAEPVFVDANVLVYAALVSAPLHGVAAITLKALRQANVPLWTSRQVFREYLATLTRPQTFSAPLPASALTADIRCL